MSQDFFTVDPSSIAGDSALSAPSTNQEVELINNKQDKDGNHYLKVLLLSNKLTRNKWVVPYQKIGDLPKEVIDSFVGLPMIKDHHYPYFQQLKEKLVKEGKQHEEIAQILRKECEDLGISHIDHLFYDPNSPLLYGQLKEMDPEENLYIEKFGKPSKGYTSPGIFGDSYELENGINVYDPKTLRAFHLAPVDIPAFPEQEAAVKAICKNGNSQSCRKTLAVAGFDSTVYPVAQLLPLENVNNNCSCNKNIDMSNNTTPPNTPQPELITNASNTPTITPVIPAQGNLVEGAKNSTQEAIDAARQEAQKVVEENSKKKEAEENKKPELTPAEIELKETNKSLQKEREEKLEMKNFFLEKMLISAIPRENFAKEDEFIHLKESTKGLINKYGMSLEDADWLINKVSKSVPPLSSTDKDDDKKKTKKDVGVGGWYGSTYNSDTITRPQQQNVPKPSSGSNSGIDDEDFPIPF